MNIKINYLNKKRNVLKFNLHFYTGKILKFINKRQN